MPAATHDSALHDALLTPSSVAPYQVVLDSNIVLDWLVFINHESELIIKEVIAHNLVWIASLEMKAELSHVLCRGLGRQRHEIPEDWHQQWEELANLRLSPQARLPSWPRCTDSDDQKFIDFALAQGARWLVSRDRAVLKVAKRCRSLGLSVVTPAQWFSEYELIRRQTR